ncbi:hypothetical protein CCACVL1_20395 [Corchorus capsularis]|uniref:Uncharacterized protein n=1 Tax=Corchorus capsularis TaxID=210143 RepID=A0A1R3HBF1_COCAP|nr:hypothetical protein CCACVL1_20395 [Corchorus capsularis]
MEELGSMWNYQENVDELKLKLQYTTIELESLKMEANEQIRKHKEEIKQLLNLLKLAYQERDEARDELQKLLNKLMILPSSPVELQKPTSLIPYSQSENPLIIAAAAAAAAKANSSITESSSLSDTYNNNNNHHSHNSSPVDSFFDAVTSPDFSSINMVNQQQQQQQQQPFVHNGSSGSTTGLNSPAIIKVDPAATVIDNLAKGKTLPQKGKLLQAVMEAGPLIQTLLVAGPLPRWRNPPPLQSFKIPPVSIKGCDSNKKPAAAANPNKSNSIVQKRLNPYPEISRQNQMCSSAALLNFASSGSSAASGLSNAQMLAASSGKRQRFQ